jgi:methyltransferase (TIGR00027 family)
MGGSPHRLGPIHLALYHVRGGVDGNERVGSRRDRAACEQVAVVERLSAVIPGHRVDRQRLANVCERHGVAELSTAVCRVIASACPAGTHSTPGQPSEEEIRHDHRGHRGGQRAVSGDEEAPDSTAVRVALWRALHVEVDEAPPVLEDVVGLQLAAPDPDWRGRGDMHPLGTRGFRAAIVARARFIEDLVAEQAAAGVTQYVILGAGLDTLAQRRPDLGGRVRIFEVDQPGTQAWKGRRLVELGYGVPDWLRLVPIDFETGESWWDGLCAAGFDPDRPAVVASTGVSMYLTKDATAATLRQLAALAPGSSVVMTFLLPIELLDEADRPGLEMSARGARASGTPFVSFYRPDEMLALARAAGFPDVRHVSSRTLADRYFAGRADGLRPSTGEDLLLAGT